MGSNSILGDVRGLPRTALPVEKSVKIHEKEDNDPRLIECFRDVRCLHRTALPVEALSGPTLFSICSIYALKFERG